MIKISGNDYKRARKKVENLIEKNERLGEALAWLIYRTRPINIRQLRVVSGADISELEELEIIKIHDGGKPMFYINRLHDVGRAVHKGTMEEINRDLLESLQALQDAGYEIPIEMKEEELVFRADKYDEWLRTMNGTVWYADSDKAQRVNEDKFGYPLIVRKGRSISLTDKGKEICSKLKITENFDGRYAERFKQSQETGIYTTVNSNNEVFFEWIYRKFRENSLTQEQMEFALEEIEMPLQKNAVREDEVDQAIDKAIERLDTEREEDEE